ncbi:MAG: hypothetical protein OQK48_00890 [Sulfurimonas sp.]|uniref:hypothetical protein n=1 Tax=Sulfurimonas sp. TaxID=2022749 RepID=UPI0026392D59|nr:hypothetical protein [Sulfurimonas sp.]MCW8894415.1 hypothetical protein [Sulfurimonas sp.]MCW8953480.1 hypothetical protein [Sulfurimonas sp.]MCW9068352.1 hypothetical protein [Sulfurimonas sp.]
MMKSFKITAPLLLVSLLFSTSAIAAPNLPPPIADVVEMEKLAGDPGPFVAKEDFPKGYLLITKNLPFLVGLSLYNSNSSNLELTKQQIAALVNIQKTVMPQMAKVAIKIKKLELEIVSDIALQYNDVKAESFFDKVDEIAKLRAELTKSHLRCITKVKTILTADQYEELLDYGIVNMF